jgi:PII-like signaling protein
MGERKEAVNSNRDVAIDGEILQIYIDEAARCGHTSLHSWIVQQAHKSGMTAAYVFRANEGFGLNRVMQTTKIVDLSCNLPLVVVVIDSHERISEFRSLIGDKVKKGLIVCQQISLQIQNQN